MTDLEHDAELTAIAVVRDALNEWQSPQGRADQIQARLQALCDRHGPGSTTAVVAALARFASATLRAHAGISGYDPARFLDDFEPGKISQHPGEQD